MSKPHKRKGYVFGRLILTTTTQPANAPIIDPGWTRDSEGRRYTARIFHLRPWQRDRYGDRRSGPALVVGLRRDFRFDPANAPVEAASPDPVKPKPIQKEDE